MSELRRGEIWWVDLGEARGAAPAFRRPVVVVQSDPFNRSRIGTVLCVALTSNLDRSRAPGNVLVKKAQSGLPQDSVVNVSNVVTVDRGDLHDRVGALSAAVMRDVDEGLRLVLDL